MRTGVIILSRMSSRRLPGKALKKIKGKEVLLHIVEGVQQIIPDEYVIVATSLETSDDALIETLEDHEVNYFRGSLNNVSNRFYEASKAYNLDGAIRVNGDNIFLESDSLKDSVFRLSEGYDFVSNVKGRTFPKGMSIEGVNLDYYESLLPKIYESEYHKEHVMSLLYELESHSYFIKNTTCPEASGIHLALDTPEDLKRTQGIMERLEGPNWEYGLNEIYEIYNSIVNE